MMQFGCPTIHRFTFLSSPPVASVRPFVGLSDRQLTFEPCAKNSPVQRVNSNKRAPPALVSPLLGDRIILVQIHRHQPVT